MWGEPVGGEGGQRLVSELKRSLHVVVELGFVSETLAGLQGVHADALGAGEPTDLVNAVTSQVVEGAGVDVGVEIPGRAGLAAHFVRVGGYQTGDLA